MSEVDFIDIFSGNLNSLLKDTLMSPGELAEASGLGRSTISRYLSGKMMPSVRAIVNLSIALDCEIDQLIPIYDLIN